MLKKAIIATDLSVNSSALINCLDGLKAYGVEKCLLLKCLSAQESLSIGLSYSTYKLEQTIMEEKSIIEDQGFLVETRMLSGDLSDEINQIAVNEDYPLIVVGAKNRAKLSEIFFNGIADDVIHHAQKPILLIKLKDQLGEGLSCLKASGCGVSNHILFPTDFSENADTAFNYLTKLLSKTTKKVTLVHVQDKAKIKKHLGNRLEEFNEIDKQRLENMKKVLQERTNVEVDITLKYGSPTEEILKIQTEIDVDLIVMGSQGRGYVKELFIGSVSHNIVRLSTSTILLIPKDATI